MSDSERQSMAAESFHADLLRQLVEAMPFLTLSEFRVLIALASYVKDRSGQAFPALKDISRRSGIARDFVKTAVCALSHDRAARPRAKARPALLETIANGGGTGNFTIRRLRLDVLRQLSSRRPSNNRP